MLLATAYIHAVMLPSSHLESGLEMLSHGMKSVKYYDGGSIDSMMFNDSTGIMNIYFHKCFYKFFEISNLYL